ncbi:hypothetical protein D3C78_1197670 [compost metagenome]
MIAGSTPATAMERMTANGWIPRSMARWPDMTIMHDAPSVICDEVPAVTVPPFGLNAGFSDARPSRVVSGRMVSSKSNTFRKPFSS